MTTGTYEDLLLEKDGAIATITLNNPEKLNAISHKMRVSLSLAADEVAKDDEVRVVIVTGAGRGFCSGADVTAMLGGAGGTNEVSRYARSQVLRHFTDIFPNQIVRYFSDVFPMLNKPVIAAINGPCAGGGFSVALSCDIRIASETARFSVAQVARGLVPDAGMTFYLPHAIGMSSALKLMFTAEIIGAAEAERLGIVSQVVPPGELMKVARELAGKIAQQAPISVELTKKMVWRGLFDSLNRQRDLETWALQICHQTEDHKEAVRSFLEKRPPAPFKGR